VVVVIVEAAVVVVVAVATTVLVVVGIVVKIIAIAGRLAEIVAGKFVVVMTSGPLFVVAVVVGVPAKEAVMLFVQTAAVVAATQIDLETTAEAVKDDLKVVGTMSMRDSVKFPIPTVLW
jgi:hypothetical protein